MIPITPVLDDFQQAHADANKAVATFLPSLVPKPPGPQSPPPPPPALMEPIRALSMGRHVEQMSARVARGLPAVESQPTPEHEFGAELDPVHIRAISEAIAMHPETQRAGLIHEAHESLVRWLAANNGRVVVDGKMMLAHNPQAAEVLAAKIINGAVEDHDQRRAVEQAQPATPPASPTPQSGQPAESAPAATSAVSGAQVRPVSPAPQMQDGTQNPTDSGAAPSPVRSDLSPSPDATTPEITPPSGGAIEDKGPAPEVTPAEAEQVGTTQDGDQITQPKNSVEANQKLAMEAAPELEQSLSALTSQVPGMRFARLRPQKDEDRIGQKVEDDHEPNTVSDYLGAQLAADTPQAKDKMLGLLQKHFKVIEVDDHFLKGRNDKAGYPSTNVQVQLSNGLTAEVQIVPKEVQDATDETHKLYKAGRDAEAAGDNEERDRQWGEAKKIHEAKLDEFKARNGIGDKEDQTVPNGTNDTHASLRQSLEAAGVKPVKLGGKLFYPLDPEVESGDGSQIPSSESPQQGGQGSGQNGEQDTQPPADNGVRGGDANPVPAREPAAPDLPDATRNTRPTKGQVVTLQDGTQGEVVFVHPNMNFMRVRTKAGVVTAPTTNVPAQ